MNEFVVDRVLHIIQEVSYTKCNALSDFWKGPGHLVSSLGQSDASSAVNLLLPFLTLLPVASGGVCPFREGLGAFHPPLGFGISLDCP